jgi:rubrerythrin
MARDAREMGRPDIGLILNIIANEEHNHLKILEALIPKSGLSEEDFADLPNEIIKQTAMRSQ